APVVGLSVRGGRHMPGGAFQESASEVALESPDRFSGRRTRNTQIGRCGREAATVDDPDEETHCIETIHNCSEYPNFVARRRVIIPRSSLPTSFPSNGGRDMRLKDKTAIVTGAGKGIGAAIARR